MVECVSVVGKLVVVVGTLVVGTLVLNVVLLKRCSCGCGGEKGIRNGMFGWEGMGK